MHMSRRLLQLLVLGSMAFAASSPPSWAQPPAQPPSQAQGRGGRGFVPVQIGPSAPVPPEVAMLRPSAAELTELNQALKTFVDTNASPARTC